MPEDSSPANSRIQVVPATSKTGEAYEQGFVSYHMRYGIANITWFGCLQGSVKVFLAKNRIIDEIIIRKRCL